MSLVSRRSWLSCLLLAAAACSGEPAADQAAPVAMPTPAQAVEELLQADRAFARAAADTDLVSALTAMFSADVMMPAPGVGIASGREQVVNVLGSNPENATSRVEWTPVRGGISADGTHGFTFGYITTVQADSTRIAGKYLSYWVKGADGWRVAAYKRGRRADEAVDMAMMPPSIPSASVAPTADPATVAAHRESLAAAEKAFSDEAAVVGLGPAFAKHGHADAVNMGGPSAAWVVGADSIAAGFGPEGNQPSPLVWGADFAVLVASSGDLGVTFGTIHQTSDLEGDGFPFFTIWRRDAPDAPWRYIAE